MFGFITFAILLLSVQPTIVQIVQSQIYSDSSTTVASADAPCSAPLDKQYTGNGNSGGNENKTPQEGSNGKIVEIPDEQPTQKSGPDIPGNDKLIAEPNPSKQDKKQFNPPPEWNTKISEPDTGKKQFNPPKEWNTPIVDPGTKQKKSFDVPPEWNTKIGNSKQPNRTIIISPATKRSSVIVPAPRKPLFNFPDWFPFRRKSTTRPKTPKVNKTSSPANPSTPNKNSRIPSQKNINSINRLPANGNAIRKSVYDRLGRVQSSDNPCNSGGGDSGQQDRLDKNYQPPTEDDIPDKSTYQPPQDSEKLDKSQSPGDGSSDQIPDKSTYQPPSDDIPDKSSYQPPEKLDKSQPPEPTADHSYDDIENIRANNNATSPAPSSQLDSAVVLDYNTLLGCYSDTSQPKSCTKEQKKKADLDHDGNVNQIDYILFLKKLKAQSQ